MFYLMLSQQNPKLLDKESEIGVIDKTLCLRPTLLSVVCCCEVEYEYLTLRQLAMGKDEMRRG